MYKLMIVDDEYMILEGMKRLIDYQSMGLELIYTCDNSIDALAYALENPIDIVITDISMPEMTGLELIEGIKKVSKETDFLIMSGFQEFNYARKAISLGAVDYLVKPINKYDLSKSLEKIVTQKTAKSKNAKAFLRGEEISILSLKESLEEENIYFVASKSTPSNYLVTIERVIGQHKISFSLSNTPIEDNIYQEKLEESSKMYDIREKVQTSLFWNSSVSGKSANLPTYKSLYLLVQSGDIKSLLLKLSDVKKEFELNCPNEYITKQFFVQLMNDVYQQLNKNDDLDSLFSIVKECETFDELFLEIENRLKRLIDIHKYNIHVKQVLEILYSEYYKELNLKEVSQRLFLNSVYLGQLIKKETGYTFSELLNRERIKVAQSLLLSTDENIEEICFKVGYTNIGYFYKIFKRLCHESPKSYREQIRKF